MRRLLRRKAARKDIHDNKETTCQSKFRKTNGPAVSEGSLLARRPRRAAHAQNPSRSVARRRCLYALRGACPNKPVIAIEIKSRKPDDWSPLLADVWGEAMKDPAQWRRKRGSGADLLVLALMLADSARMRSRPSNRCWARAAFRSSFGDQDRPRRTMSCLCGGGGCQRRKTCPGYLRG